MAALLVGAAALRARHLGTPTLTGDEWFMLRNAHEGPAWIISQARVFEPHPLVYYLGFWAWVAVSGSAEWAMRYPSALFGVLTCAAVWRLGRETGGPVVALGQERQPSEDAEQPGSGQHQGGDADDEEQPAGGLQHDPLGGVPHQRSPSRVTR